MKVVFISNYYTPHQAPFCEAMYRLTNGKFWFIATIPMEEERKQMGWEQDEGVTFVKHLYVSEDTRQECAKLIIEADCVITGTGNQQIIHERLKSNKLVFLYSERVYKNHREIRKIPFHWYRFRKWYANQNIHLLCASAFASADYAISRCFLDKAYKWGYFPALRVYPDLDTLFSKKHKSQEGLKGSKVSILWVARLIRLKHPEYAIEVANKLVKDGFSFELNIIGSGEEEGNVKALIDKHQLGNYVHLLGKMAPDKVRDVMETHDILLFTSDKNEGWGAVLNEAMNSGCAVVSSHIIGATPYLIKEYQNGLIFKSGDIDDLYKKVKWLIENATQCQYMGKNAYYTILNEWNSDVAAERLLSLAKCLLEKMPTPYETGICSKAAILKNNWY